MPARSGILIEAIDRTQQVFDRIEARTRRFQRVVSGAGGALAGVFGGQILTNAALDATRALIDTRKEADKIKITFQQGFGQKAAEEMMFVREEAERLGLSYTALSKGYAQMAIAAQGSSLEGEKLREVFLGVVEASAVFGLSQQDTDGVMRAMIQSISKGTIQAEELRGQLGDRLPGAFKVMAASIGITEKQLDKFLEQGLIRADSSLLEFSRKLRELVGPNVERASQTLRAEAQRLGNSWFQLKNELSQGIFAEIVIFGIKEAKAQVEDVAQLSREVNQIGSGLSKLGGDFRQFYDDSNLAFFALSDLAVGVKKFADENSKIGKINLNPFDFVGRIRDSIAGLSEASKQYLGTVKEIEDETVKLTKNKPGETYLNILNEQWEKYAAKSQSRQQALEAEIAEIGRIGEAAGKTAEEIKRVQDAFRRKNSPKGRRTSSVDKELNDVTRAAERAAEKLKDARRELDGILLPDDASRQELFVRELTVERETRADSGERPEVLAALDRRIESEQRLVQVIRDQATAKAEVKAIELSRREFDDEIADVEESNDALRDRIRVMKDENSAVDQLKSSIIEINIARTQEKLNMEGLAEGNIELNNALEERVQLLQEELKLQRQREYTAELKQELKDMQAEQKKANEGWKSLGLTMASAFEDAIVEGSNLRDMLKGIEKDIVRIITRQLVTQPLANALTGIVGGFAQSYFGGSVGGTSYGTYSDGGGGYIQTSFGGRQLGGSVAKHSMYEVAEHGKPELLTANNKSFLLTGNKSAMVERIDKPQSVLGNGAKALDQVRDNERMIAEQIKKYFGDTSKSPQIRMGAGRSQGGRVYENTMHEVVERNDPELFKSSDGRSFLIPGAGGGRVSPMSTNPSTAGNDQSVHISFTLNGVTDAESFERSESQIQRRLTDAVDAGQRNR